jgi:transcriptional regulator
MYNLSYFKERDENVIRNFIRQNPFALLNGVDENRSPVTTQLPLFLEEENSKQFLRGHMMRKTDHHKAMVQNDNVLVIFTGAHCYVSATWYSDPHQASTWNYMSVHVKGRIRFCDDDALIKILRKTTLYFENNNRESATVFDNLPDKYLKRLMPAIVAFEIEIDSMENVFKLSQNRDRQSYLNIMEQLKKGNQNEKNIAGAMAERFENLFSEV